MGHKVNPIGFRLPIRRDWQSRWYSEKQYRDFLMEDLKLRKTIESMYKEAGISKVEIERWANESAVTIYTSRPGIVIGRGGQRVNETRAKLESLIGKKIQLNIKEVSQPELDALLVAKSVAEQIERRIAYRRAMKQTIFRTMQAGAKGIRIRCGGRLAGAEIARREVMHQGRVPLHTLRADIDYGFTEANTIMGKIGIKVWVYKGDILPEIKTEEAEEIAPPPPPPPVSQEVAPTPAPTAESPEAPQATTETPELEEEALAEEEEGKDVAA